MIVIESVANIATVAPGPNQSQEAQHPQLLRYHRGTEPAGSSQIFYRPLNSEQGAKDPQPARGGEGGHGAGEFFRLALRQGCARRLVAASRTHGLYYGCMHVQMSRHQSARPRDSRTDAEMPAHPVARCLGVMHSRLRHAHADMFGLGRHAGWYDSLPGRLARPLYRRVAADVADAHLPAGALVLDVGTGPGRVPLLIAEAHPHLQVEGIDPSREMIDRAKRTAASADTLCPRLRYTIADVAHLPHRDGSVDLVVSSLSLHHWADVPAGLREIQRVLRRGGQAWIYDVRPVLNRAAIPARAQGLAVFVEPLGRHADRLVSSRSLTNALLGRLLAQLRIEG